jgi:RHS repeat-associated protein
MLRRLIAVACLGGAAGGALACPETPGPTCSAAAASPASQPLGLAVNVGAGNPINVINGNKYQREDDMPALPGVMGLEIVRHYNSSLGGPDAWTGRVGRGWRLSYETRLVVAAGSIDVLQADGGSVTFVRDALKPSVATTDNPAHGVITVKRAGRGSEYLWRWADGRELSFNTQGQLVQIKAATGEITSLMYDPRGPLVRVTDPQGRSLQLHYLDRDTAAKGDRFRGVQSIDTPVGRFSYEYGSALPKGSSADKGTVLANLVRVRYPEAGQGRQYHYEDALHPTFLTGISIEGQGTDGKPQVQRYATFGYNAIGKGILSTHAGGVDKVALDFERPGVTIMTNSLGQKTTYRYAGSAGDFRLVEVRGAGCTLCGPPNQRYRYDKLGRLVETIQLDQQGIPTDSSVSELDDLGRTVQVSRVVYRNGKAGPAQMQIRYEYSGRADTPSLIARPSVVPGKETRRHIVLGPYGRPLRATDEGFVPGPDGKAVLEISRSVSFRYNARGQVLETDGPLPNAAAQPGPGDSDISRYEYDAATGLLTRSIAAGNIVTEVLERDAALRPLRLRTSDGDTVQVIQLRRNWRGQPEQTTVEATPAGEQRRGAKLTRIWRYRYDSEGSLVATVQPGELTTTFEYDANGRLVARVLPDGSRVAGLEEGAAAASATQLQYDDNGWVTLRVDAAGSGDAASTRFAYDSHGQVTRVVDPNGVVTNRRYDDFGAKVMESNGDRGLTAFRYDAAGRMVAKLDPSGTVTRYSYDHTGRLTALGTDQLPNLVQYRYRGLRLAEVITSSDGQPAHATERIEYETDPFGQVVREQRWIGPIAGAGAGAQPAMAAGGLTFVTAYQYDDAGRLLSQTLADGHRLHYRYTPAGQPGAGLLSALLFDEQLVVSQIRQTQQGGISGYLMGNGVRQRIVFDARHHIAELSSTVEPPQRDGWGARLAGWWTPAQAPGAQAAAQLYRQLNRYDTAGRLVGAERQSATSPPRVEQYDYDGLDRLLGVRAADGSTMRWTYDRGGNRTAQTAQSAAGEALTQHYRYAPGSNRLSAIESGDDAVADRAEAGIVGAAEPAQLHRAAWMYRDSGAPLAQLLLARPAGAGPQALRRAARRIVYGSGDRPLAVYEGQRLVASYRYNSQGERIARTTYGQQGQPGRSVYSLFRSQQLAAEADEQGRVTAHYVYLGGKAIAKIEMAPRDGFWHRAWRGVVTLGGLRDGDPAGDSVASIYAIHGDHLGTPQLVTDAEQRVVWQADTTPFGLAHIRYAAERAQGGRFELALRLPGQQYDSTTGLHYNYARDYDPQSGRYTTPDPMGLEGGINPYAYAGANPLSKADPLGLYQIDVHYFTTYFLAVTSGVDRDVARRIALATQYIDDNEVTRPMKPGHGAGDLIDSIFINQPALQRYHFVMAGHETPRTTLEKLAYLATGHDLQSYIDRRIEHPSSPQLSRLYAASQFAKTDPNANCMSSIQLFGEYLHTFEDTFAHRDQENNPYDATLLSLGIGHGAGGENPDYTYNHFGFPLGLGWWLNNESRTLQMEKEVFAKMQAYTNPKNQQYSWSAIAYTMKTFNEFKASDSSPDFNDKIAILNKGLKTLGYAGIDLSLGGVDGYDEQLGAKNRGDALNNLKPTDYIGTILPQGTAPLPK